MSFSTLFAGIVFGCVGFAAWQIGRKRQQVRPMVLGVALMGFSYVAPDGWITWAIGGALTLLVFYP